MVSENKTELQRGLCISGFCNLMLKMHPPVFLCFHYKLEIEDQRAIKANKMIFSSVSILGGGTVGTLPAAGVLVTDAHDEAWQSLPNGNDTMSTHIIFIHEPVNLYSQLRA